MPVTRSFELVQSRPAPRAGRVAPPHLLNGELSIEVAEGAEAVSRHASAWDELASDVAEPNVFNERWMLEPAIQQFAGNESPRLIFVYRRGKRQDVEPALVGLFPLHRVRIAGSPVRVSRLWGHDYGFLRTPLIRNGHLIETLSTFLNWLENVDRTSSALEMPQIHGEGPVAKALVQVFYERKNLFFVRETYNRALLCRAASGDDYIQSAVSSHQRQEIKRQSRRLGELGAVETRHLSNETQLEYWLDEFLRLESLGWKGSEGTAFAASERAKTYFKEICRAAWAQGQLHMLGIFLSGVPIAMKVNFLCGNGGYAFKIAYSEEYAKYSPGVQLELENIRSVHELPDWQWMDSSAVPNHFMINRLWKEQRTIQHLLISMGGVAGNLLVGGTPFLRSLKRILRPIRPAQT